MGFLKKWFASLWYFIRHRKAIRRRIEQIAHEAWKREQDWQWERDNPPLLIFPPAPDRLVFTAPAYEHWRLVKRKIKK